MTLAVNFRSMVPSKMTEKEFWERYYFRCDEDRIVREMKRRDEKLMLEKTLKSKARLKYNAAGDVIEEEPVEELGEEGDESQNQEDLLLANPFSAEIVEPVVKAKVDIPLADRLNAFRDATSKPRQSDGPRRPIDIRREIAQSADAAPDVPIVASQVIATLKGRKFKDEGAEDSSARTEGAEKEEFGDMPHRATIVSQEEQFIQESLPEVKVIHQRMLTERSAPEIGKENQSYDSLRPHSELRNIVDADQQDSLRVELSKQAKVAEISIIQDGLDRPLETAQNEWEMETYPAEKSLSDREKESVTALDGEDGPQDAEDSSRRYDEPISQARSAQGIPIVEGGSQVANRAIGDEHQAKANSMKAEEKDLIESENVMLPLSQESTEEATARDGMETKAVTDDLHASGEEFDKLTGEAAPHLAVTGLPASVTTATAETADSGAEHGTSRGSQTQESAYTELQTRDLANDQAHELDGKCKLIILISSIPGNLTQATHQKQAMAILQGYDVEAEFIDGTDPTQLERRDELFAISGILGNYPQLFVTDERGTNFLCDFEKLDAMNNSGSLATILKPLVRSSTITTSKAELDALDGESDARLNDTKSGRKMIMLVCYNSDNLAQATNEKRAMILLHELGVELEIIDGADLVHAQRQDELFAISGIHHVYPQFFITDGVETSFLGDFGLFESMYRSGDLASMLAALPTSTTLPGFSDTVSAKSAEGPSSEQECVPSREESREKLRIEGQSSSLSISSVNEREMPIRSEEGLFEYTGLDEPPVGMKRLLVLIYDTPDKALQFADQKRAMTVLHDLNIRPDYVNGAEPGQEGRQLELFLISGLEDVYPQFFLVDANNAVFFGDMKAFDSMHEQGTLASALASVIDKTNKSIEMDKRTAGEQPAPVEARPEEFYADVAEMSTEAMELAQIESKSMPAEAGTVEAGKQAAGEQSIPNEIQPENLPTEDKAESTPRADDEFLGAEIEVIPTEQGEVELKERFEERKNQRKRRSR